MPTETSATLSPFLATQTALQRRAIQLIARPDVRAAVTRLAKVWQDGTPGFLPQTYAQLDDSINEVVFLVALQVVNSDPHRPQVVEISAAPHRWGGLDVPGGRWGINNPDTLYFAIPIEPGSSYLLTGRRYANAPVDTNFSVQVPDIWASLDNLNGRDLLTDADGSYQITIDQDPANGRANHLQIKPDGRTLIIRQTLGDWAIERPDSLQITRISGPEAPPPSDEDALAAQLIDRLATVIDHSLQTLQPPILRNPVNTIPQPGAPGNKSGYLTAQRNTLGHFDLGPDDALIATLSPGGAGYAAFTATNLWGVTTASDRHQNSLNSLQADIDADGDITLVIANRDPGVANWIDPGGLEQGLFMLRWQLLADEDANLRPPGIQLRKVRFQDLTAELPDGLRRLDANARSLQIAARAKAYSTRFEDR